MKQVQMYVNGHTLKTNPGYAGGGVVLECNGRTREEMIAVGIATHHQAEIEAVMLGLNLLSQACAVTVFSCNQWLVNCGSGKWSRSSRADMWDLYEIAAIEHEVTFEWIKKGGHELLDRASALANEGANESALELS